MFILGKHQKDYVSELDGFLQALEAARQGDIPPAKMAEIKKHRAIFEKRDHPLSKKEKPVYPLD